MSNSQGRSKTIIQKLEEVTSPAIARFVIYYETPEDQRENWETFSKCHQQLAKTTYEHALEYLTRSDAQEALRIYHKEMKNYDMSRLYESMLQKALDGDTRAASWVTDFVSKSEYFDDSTDEIDDFLSKMNIPSLKEKP